MHLLAEPNLTTMSGEPASFLVGGEFPIPISQQNNAITVVFKQYGVNLSFVPTVMSDGRINIHVRPEVSQLTNQGAVQLSSGNNSISVPALTVRRADTTVEVGSGDSFAIAGLLQETVTHGTSAIPLLGELPILGPLFRSDSFQRNESELVIIVTPFIVRPVSDRLACISRMMPTFLPLTWSASCCCARLDEVRRPCRCAFPVKLDLSCNDTNLAIDRSRMPAGPAVGVRCAGTLQPRRHLASGRHL